MAIDIDKAMPLLLERAKDLQVPIVDLIHAQTKEPWMPPFSGYSCLLDEQTKNLYLAVIIPHCR
ncbi:hypothetical protein ACFL6U_09950 [Planctomycetota bacterium]